MLTRSLAGRVFQDVERQCTYQFHLDETDGLTVSIPEKPGQDRFPLTYALGSGQHALSLLSLIPDRQGDTVGIEHRVSLYRKSDQWELALTPGHRGAIVAQDVEQFGKVIRGDTLAKCVGCHTTTADIVGRELQNLRPNVGCQACHGPGREHLIAAKLGRSGGYAGFTAQTATQEMQMCGQCHRLPGEAAEDVVIPDDIHNARFQPASLVQSRCFQVSQSLKCSTCHDPHQPVLRDQNHYVQRCRSCHDGENSSKVCPVSPREKCTPCHMPAVDVHREITFHDHWIRVRSDRTTLEKSP